MPGMPSTRRIKALGILVLLFVVITLYVTSAARQTRESAFYTKTQNALAEERAAKEASLGSKDSTPDLDPGSDAVAKRLKEAEEQAKKAADKKAEEFHGEDVVEDKKREKEYIDKKMEKEAAAKAKLGSQDVMKGKWKEEEKKKKQAPETEEEHQVKDELNSILKRSPVIIFSKSYCPYSRKAKDILLTRYKITPPPFVVELDEHPLGPQLQAELGTITGRRTVPNILINGKSIGGGDDVEQLHEDNKLMATVKDLVGKRVEISAVAPSVEKEKDSS